MPRKRTAEKLPRGIFEKPPGSGIYGIHYYDHGQRHREIVGPLSAAIALREERKTDIRKGRKLPDFRNKRYVTVAELVDDVLEYVVNHKDRRSYESKAVIVKKALGGKKADDLKPKEISAWLNSHCKTPATHNRYRAFLSLAYRLGEENDKVERNPARKAAHRTENNARTRFLSREEEYPRLVDAIRSLFPEHLPEFIVSVHTGMRLSEMYTIEWSQYRPDPHDASRRLIDLSKTKNGDPRKVHLNADAQAAIDSLRTSQKMKGRMFPRQRRVFMVTREGVRKENFDNRSWFNPSLEEAGISDYSWHSNRHTFCSWLAMAGASTIEIQKAAGHRAIAMAARYSHLSPKHEQSVVDRIAGTDRGNQQPPKRPPQK